MRPRDETRRRNAKRRGTEQEGKKGSRIKGIVIVARALYVNLQTRRFEKDVPDNMENVEPGR